MDEQELSSWVSRAQAGDAQALEVILRHSEPAMQRLARRVCPSADASDAVQEVLFRATRQVGSLRVGAAFVGWSMKMLVRECLHLKIKAARWLLQGEIGETAVDPNGRSVTDVLHWAQLLAGLSEKSREILIHHEILGNTVLEASELLGISEESAKSRLRRARVELRVLWDEDRAS